MTTEKPKTKQAAPMDNTQADGVFSTEAVKRNIDGVDIPCTRIAFGAKGARPRSVEIRDTMGPGDYLQAIETYGGTKNDSSEGLIMLAFRLISLDDKPVPPYRDRKEVHQFLNRLGNDGVAAIARVNAVTDPATEDDVMDTVGNS